MIDDSFEIVHPYEPKKSSSLFQLSHFSVGEVLLFIDPVTGEEAVRIQNLI